MFTQFDSVIIIITMVFATLGLFKGAVRSILGLVKYYGAAAISIMLYPQTKEYIGSIITVSLVANGTAIFITYVGALIVLSILIGILCTAMGSTVGGPTDRLIGAIVGVTIGLIIGSTAHLMVRSNSGGSDPSWLENGRTYKITAQGADILGKYFQNIMQGMGTDFGFAKDFDTSEIAKGIIESSSVSTGNIDFDKLKEAVKLLKDKGVEPTEIKDMINVEDYKKTLDDSMGGAGGVKSLPGSLDSLKVNTEGE